MTERERLLEKIRKVQALANRGADGEKQSAAALLDRPVSYTHLTLPTT